MTTVENYVEQCLNKNGRAKGRPSFVTTLKLAGKDPVDEIFNIFEYAWIKNRSPQWIGKKYRVSHMTIVRLLKIFDPDKEAIIDGLAKNPRKKTFYNRETNRSDYPTVQQYIERAKRDGLVKFKNFIRQAERYWKHSGHKDPATWKANPIIDFLMTIKGTGAGRSNMVDAVRCVAPQLTDRHSTEYLSTGRWREKVGKRRKPLFGKDLLLVFDALQSKGLDFEEVIFKLHVALGAREGSSNSESGMVGLSWDRFGNNFNTVDLWESKVRGGIWSRDCPVARLFKDLPQRLREIWIERGKPKQGKLILGGYKELTAIYERIRVAIKERFENSDEVDAKIYQEMYTLRPHDADKIHVNCLWEAGVPLEVVKGIYEGHGEGQGLVGRIWLDINTITEYYLSLDRKSQRIQRVYDQIDLYSEGFRGGSFSYFDARTQQKIDNGKQFDGGEYKSPRGGR